MTININNSIFDKYEESVDWMIANLGVDCKIVYPPIKNECPNCYVNNMPGVGASNVYRTNGPYPFTEGICPYCEGMGFKETSTSETIRVRTYFDLATINKLASWNVKVPTIGVPNGVAIIIGYMKDVPKFQNMAFIELVSNVEGIFSPCSYTLCSDVTPWGMKKKRYFHCTVQRNG